MAAVLENSRWPGREQRLHCVNSRAVVRPLRSTVLILEGLDVVWSESAAARRV